MRVASTINVTHKSRVNCLATQHANHCIGWRFNPVFLAAHSASNAQYKSHVRV